MKYDFAIVGAGFAGSVCAEQLGSRGKRVLLIDARPHIGGNAYDERDRHGVLVHPYGPHIFHTSSKRVFDYLSQFTDWRFYEHRVLAHVNGQLLPIPINKTTINKLYGLNLNEDGVSHFLKRAAVPRAQIKTSEDVVLSTVGSDLCDKFFRGYTRKQWGIDLSGLSASVAARIPTRTNDDDRYFVDAFQFMPAQGYATMFARILDNPLIEVRLNTPFADIGSNTNLFDRLIYTGPIDSYFDFRFGKLPYRSLRFEHQHISQCDKFQPVGTINYPNDHEYTRVTEFRYLTGQTHSGTSIVREYPNSEGDPYYPIPRPENEALFQRYKKLAAEVDALFVGRLAEYRYFNMDQVVGAALALINKLSLA